MNAGRVVTYGYYLLRVVYYWYFICGLTVYKGSVSFVFTLAMLLACLFVFVGVCDIVVGFAFFGCFYFACSNAFLFAYLFVFV